MKLRILSIFLALWCTTQIAFAEQTIKSYEFFKRIPVMSEGRLKPLDTYARNLLIQLSGKDHYEHKSGIAWLSQVLFDADATKDDKIFLINNPETATAIDLPADEHRRYTASQLQKNYKKLAQSALAARNIPEKERSIVENELIRVFDNINIYADTTRSMVFAYPHASFTIHSMATKNKLGLPADQNEFSFIDMALKADVLTEMTKNLENKSNADFSSDEAEIVKVVQNLYQWSNLYKELPLAVIPSSQKDHHWHSPWDAINHDFTDDQSRQLLTLWRNMALSYKQGQDVQFNVAAHMYVNAIADGLDKEESKHFNKFDLELFYHASSPFLWAKVFYILAFIFFFISFISSNRAWYWFGLGSIVAGFIPHFLGLVARIIIMARPPVSNLYETFIFVGFIAVFLGLLIEHFNRQWLGIVTAAISGAALLFIAGKYSAEGDTLKMLVAVLNSNFWLATHVTTITMGYAATCVAGVVGHIWLIQAALGKDKEVLEKTYKTILGVLAVSLPLTFLGTNLGGIWADQSWGRFWGWDPKENGALMIVLWTTIILHAKVSRLIGSKGLAICSVLGMVVVMWAWFGVNLLSVGLHSYGFTSGIAMSLSIYVACELAFIAGTAFLIHKRQ